MDKNDKRVMETRRIAREALVTLIDDVGLGKFSITAFCKTANINRGTFYNHWKSLDEMVEDFESEFLDGLQRAISDNLKFVGDSYRRDIACRNPIPSIVGVFQYFLDNYEFVRSLTGPQGDRDYERRLHHQYLDSYVRFVIPKRRPFRSEIDERYTGWFESGATFGLILGWCISGCQETPEEMALRAIDLLYRTPPTSSI